MTHPRHQRRAQMMAQFVDTAVGAWQLQAAKGSMRLSDAERDAAARQLGEHYASGRLERAEYDDRLDAVLSARTRSELAPLFRDLPQSPVPARRPVAPPPARVRSRYRPPLFPILLVLLGVSALTGSWWVLWIGLGLLLLARHFTASARGGRSWAGCSR